MIESSRMLLEWLGRSRGIDAAVAASDSIRRALDHALSRPETRTGDIRGTTGTRGMTDAILKQLAS